MSRDDLATARRDAKLGAKSVRKERDRRDGSGFVALPFVVIDSPGFRRAGLTARALLLDLARAFTGRNNGNIWLARSVREQIGWSSESTYRAALADLIACGLLVETRRGGRNLAAWYGLTWRDLDVTAGLDIDAKQWRRGAYLTPDKPADSRQRARTAKATTARSVAAGLRSCYMPAPSDGATPKPTAPSDGAIQVEPCTVQRCSQANSTEVVAPSDGAYLEGCHLSEQRAAVDTPSADVGQIGSTAFMPSLVQIAQRSAAMRQLGINPVLLEDAAEPHQEAHEVAVAASVLARAVSDIPITVDSEEPAA